MTPYCRNTIRLLILTLGVALIVLALVALACGPSAPPNQDATPEPTATATPTNTPTPTPSIDCNSPEHQYNPECWDPPPTPSDFLKQYSKYGMADVMEDYEKAQGRPECREPPAEPRRPLLHPPYTGNQDFRGQ